MKILVTGSAGFIGMHVCVNLLKKDFQVVGIDNLNDYYDQQLKIDRNNEILSLGKSFKFIKCDLLNKDQLTNVFNNEKFDVVINLAAQAGVRYSILNPQAYIDSNIQGFINILENCRHNKVSNLIYASSSSVYGLNSSQPFKETDHADHPLALYGATKRANELMAHSYANLYNLPVTGLRFFTVYGPWGRPDMALFLFTKAIFAGEKIKVFNNGDMIRDFTYIDDIVEGVVRLVKKPARSNDNFDSKNPNPSSSSVPARIFNIGNNKPIYLTEYIEAIEEIIGKKAEKEMLPMQQGDVLSTSADVNLLDDWIGFVPNTSVKDGIKNFVNWYKNYYKETN